MSEQYIGGDLDSSLEVAQSNRPQSSVVNPHPVNRFNLLHYNGKAFAIVSGFVAILILIATGNVLFSSPVSDSAPDNSGQNSQNFVASSIPLTGIDATLLELGQASQLTLNGELRVNSSFILAPTTLPEVATEGQIYFDQTAKKPFFYDGTSFVSLAPDLADSVASIGGARGVIGLGNGLQITNGQLRLTDAILQGSTAPEATGGLVSSVQGQTGDVSFSGGNGIAINGTTITNTGLLSLGGANGNLGLGRGLSMQGGALATTISLTSGSASLVITDDGNGNYNITDTSPGSGTGGVSLGPALAQADNTGNTSININKTGASNFLQLASNGTNRFVVDQTGSIITGSIAYAQVTGAPATTVTSFGGVSGAISLGSGLSLAGATVSNTGVLSVTGTTNQIITSGSTGAVTLSLPQAIATTSNPSFNNLNLAGTLGVAGLTTLSGGLTATGSVNINTTGTGATNIGNGTGTFQLNSTGLDISTAGALSGITGYIQSSGSFSITGTGTFTTGTGAATIGSLGTGLVSSNASGLLSSGAIDRNSSTYFSSMLNAANGGTGINGSTAANGRLLIGNGTGYTLANLTQGSGISITNGAGSISIAVDSTICTTGGNCAGVGGGVTTAGGTTGTIALFTGTQAIGDSIISQSGAVISVAGTLSATALQGDGSAITDLNASNLASGTVPSARLSGAYSGVTGTGALAAGSITTGFGTISTGNTITTTAALQGNSLSIGSGTFTVSAAGAITAATGITSSGAVTFSSLNSAGIVKTNGSGALSTGLVTLGSETTGNYVATLGTLTGLSTTGNTGAGSTPTLSVTYGSAANTAAQGNTAFTFTPSGNLTGSLSGTAGAGFTTTTLAIVNNPTFSGLVTANGGLTVANATTFTNAGASLFSSVALGDLTTGTIGSAATTVDGATTFNIAQTTAGQTLSLPAPTVNTAGRIAYVNNVGSQSFTMHGVDIIASRSQQYVWNGTAWSSANIDNAGSGAGVTSVVDDTNITGSISGNVLTLGYTGTLSVARGGTGANNATDARTNLGAAASGANSDITSLSGLTTALSAGQGGTGVNGSAAANGSLLIGNGSGYTLANLTQGSGISITNGIGSIEIAVDNTICTTAGNCAGAGSGVTTAGGTTGTIALFTGAQAIGDSILSQSGATVTVAGTLAATNLQGNGSGITDINASNLTTGTVASGRISGSYTGITGTGALATGSIATGFGVISTGNNITTTAALQGNTLSIGTGTFTVNATGAITAATGITSSGAITFSNLNAVGVVKTNISGQLSTGTVALGTETTGNYVASLGTLTGLTTTGNTGAGSTPTLSVTYGSTANTSAQGDTAFTFTPSGNLTGSLSGTAGAGFTATTLAIVNNPTFSGLVTANGGLTVSGATSITGATTITGTSTFTTGTGAVTLGSLGTGIVQSDATGLLTSGTIDRNSTLLTGQTSVANGGTGATTPAGARTSLGAAASGANSDITSLSGLTTALSAGQGGTGVNGSAAANGSLLIGNGSGYTLANLTQGSGISITNGIGSIEIAVDNTICTTAGNCAGAGSGVTTAGGTTGTIALFTGAQAIGDSILSQSATTLTAAGTIVANFLQGDGSGLTNLNASNLASGTVPSARVTGTYSGLTGTSALTTGSIGSGFGTISTANTISTSAALQGNTLSIGGGSFTVNATGAVTAATGITSSGTITLSSLNTAGIVKNSALGVLSTGTVALGTETTGNYVATLGTLTGLTTTGNTGAGSTPTIAVTYGAAANTAAQGNTALSFSGSGNLTGTVSGTAGGGIATNTLAIVDNPTFSGLVTANGGLTVAGATSITGATTINTTGTASTSIGNATGTFDVTSSGVNISTAGAISGVTTLTTSGAATLGSTLEVTGASTFNGNVGISGTNTLTVGTGATQLGGTLTVGGVTTLNGNTSISGTNTFTTGTGAVTLGALGAGVVQSNASGLLTSSAIDRNSASLLSGTLSVANGGTGNATYTNAGVLYYNGTNFVSTAASTGAQCLISTGAGVAPTWGSCTTGGAGGVDSVNTFSGAVSIVGTANQVAVSNNTGTITLSTPQDINTTSAVQFGRLSVSTATNPGVGTALIFANNTNGTPTGNLADLQTGGISQFAVSAGGNVTATGSVTAVGVNGGTGLIQGTGGLTVGGTVTLSGLNAVGIVQTDASGQLSTSAIDRNSITLLTGQTSIANGGTGANNATDARTNLGAAASGANSDITSITGLTTALSAGQGGTGVNGSAAANGRLLIGNGTGYTLANLTQGTGIAITNGAGSISIAVDNTICTTSGNCAGAGSGVTTAGGTTGTIALFTGSQAIDDSILSQTATTITVGGTLVADFLQGDGSDLTNLDADALTSGTVASARIAGSYTGITGTGALAAGSISTGFGTISTGNNITTSAALQGNTLSIGTGTFTVNATGALTAATGITSSGTITLSSLNTAGIVKNNASGVLSTGTVALGTETTGNYVANLGTLTGLTTTGNTGAGSTPTLSVTYGSAANTAAQGDTALSFTGSGNLTGAISGTAGGGFTTTTLTIVNNPTFSGLVTADGGLTVASNSNFTQTGTGTLSTGTGEISLNGDVTVAAGKTISLVGGITSTRPASPTEGMLYYDTTTKQLLVYANGKWQADRSSSTIVVGTSAVGGTSGAVASKAPDGADFVNTSTTSAQTVINNAIAALPATGGSIYLMEGTYIVDANISIPNNTTFAGAGANTIIKIKNGHNAAISVLTNTDQTTGTRVTIKDLRIDGNRSNQTAGTMFGILLGGMGGGSGSSARDGATINKVTVRGIYGSSSSGVAVSGSSNSSITNVTAVNNGGSGINVTTTNYSTISGNISQGNDVNGMILNSSSNNNVTGNVFQGNASYGVFFNSANNNTFTGNSLLNTGQMGVNLSASSNTTITGNTFISNGSYGIAVFSGSNNNTISGNNLHDNGASTNNNAVYLISSDANSITGNTITDSACTTNCYAINITDSASDNTYLADNRFNPGTINDAGTGTVYANQARAVNGGQLTVRTANDTFAFSVQNAAGTALLTVDSTNSKVIAAALDVTNATALAGTLTVGGVTTFNANVSVSGTNTFNTGTGAVTLGALGAGVVQSNASGLLSSGAIDRNSATLLSNNLSVANGGTGNDTYTTAGVLYYNGTNFVSTAASTGAQCLISTGAGVAPTWGSCTTGGAGGVDSVNTFTGAISIVGTANQVAVNNNTGTITLSTPQDINTTSAVTFGRLSVSTPTNPGVGTALIFANNTNGTPTGNLADLQTGGISQFAVSAGGNVTATGSVTAVGVNGGTGLIQGTGGLTVGGTVTLSGLNAVGIVQTDASGVLSTGAIDRNSVTLLTGQTSIANGGTGATNAADARTNLGAAASGSNSDITSLSGLTTALSVGQGGTGAISLTANGILFGNGTGAVQATAAAANSILATDGSNVPGLTQTLPSTVQGNITATGILAGGSIASGFGTISTGNNITTTATIQGGTVTATGVLGGNSLSVNGGAFAVSSAGAITAATGITSSGSITFSALGAGVVKSSAGGLLSVGSVALGTDTTGNYVANLGTLTGLTTTGNTGAGSTPTLSVTYGSAADTAAQGNVTFTCPSGTGNLSGTGNSITIGAGGTCNSLTVVNNPTFSGLITADGGITVASNSNFTQTGTGTLSTGTGAVSLNGDVTVAAGKTISLVGGITATRPASPTSGMLYYDSTTNTMLQYNGSKWVSDRNTSTKIVAASNSTQAVKDSADYVATGTGDQTIINTALTAAAGGSVYLAEGTYTISASISIPDNTTLFGAGAGTVITVPNAQNGSYNMIQNTNQTTGTGVIIRDLRLDGNRANQTAGSLHGISLTNMGGGVGGTSRTGAKITNLIVKSTYTGYGIRLLTSNNNTIIGNTFQSNGSNAITLDGSVNNTITGNVMLDVGGMAINLTSNSNHNTVTGNTVQVASYGIYVVSSSDNVIASNNIQGSTTTYGVYISNSSIANSVTGNTIQVNGVGVYINTGATNTSISGNNVVSSSVGIHIINSSLNNVNGNKLHNNGGGTANNGIRLTGSSSSNSVIGNDITDTSCTTTCYAIDISDSTAIKNYLADNRFGDTDATYTASIQDLGTDTVYANQAVGVDGTNLVTRTANSATAFSVQNAAGNGVLTVDSTAGEVVLGKASTLTGKLTLANASNAFTGTLQIAAAAQNTVYTLPATGAADTICLQTLANCGSGGTTYTTAALDTVANSGQGIGISGSTIFLQSASATHAGVVNTTAQTFAGAKTFTGDVDIQSGLLNVDGTQGLVSTTQDLLVTGTIYTDGGLDVNSGGVLSVGSFASSISLLSNVTVAAGKTISLVGGITSTRPASPTEGMLYYDTTTKQLLVYANGKWQADRSSSTVVVGTSAVGGTSTAVASKAPDGADFVNTSTTSAQTVINSAIAALPATGGSVYLMEGTYIVDGPISLPTNVTLAGAGNGTVIKLKNGVNAALDVMANSGYIGGAFTGNARITLKDFRLDGNKANNTSGLQRGIFLEASDANGGYANIDSVIIENFRNSGLETQNGGFNYSTLANTIARNNGEGFVFGNGTSDSTFTGNIANLNGTGFRMDDVYGSTFTANTATNNTTDGIRIGQTDGNVFSANVISNNGRYGLNIYEQNGDIITGNNFMYNGDTAGESHLRIEYNAVGSLSGPSVTGNSFTNSNSAPYAIHLIASDVVGTYLADNRFSGTFTSGAILDTGTGTVYANQSTGANGANLVTRTANSATAFSVQNAAGNGVLTVDSANGEVELGKASTLSGKLVFYNAANAFTGTLQIATAAQNTVYTLPAAGAADTICLQTLANCGGGGTTYTTAALDTVANSGQGIGISGSTIFLQSASATHAGAVNTGTQSFAGAKTFNTGVTVFTGLYVDIIDSAGAGSIDIGVNNGDALGINLNQDVTVAAQKTIRFVGGTTAQRPASPTAGMLYYDSTTNSMLQYNGTKWVSDRSTSTKIVAASNSSQAIRDSADYVAPATGAQATINTALTAAAGGSVYLAEGTYSLTAAISIPDNTTLFGAGAGTVITVPNAQNGTYHMITNTNQTTGTGVAIRDLQIDGNRANQTAGIMRGISLTNMGGGTGTTARTGAKLTNLIVVNIYGTTTTAFGITLDSSSNNTLIGNLTKNNRSNGINLINSSNYNTITGNTSQGNLWNGIEISGSSNNTVTGNTTQGNGSYGIYVITSNNNTITGNTFQGSQAGITLSASSYNAFIGNTVQSNSGFGAFITSSSSYNNVSSNKIHDNGDTTANNGIYIQSSSVNNSITSNDITDSSCTTTCYAINITAAAANATYLADNRLSDTDATMTASIQDLGTGTVYANQSTGINGANLVIRTANDAAAFAVQNAAGNNILTVDSTNGEVELGKASSVTGKLVLYNAANAFTGTLQIAAAAQNTVYTLPAAGATDTVCLQTLGNCGSTLTTAAIDTVANSGQGIGINAGTIFLQSASGTQVGAVNISAQTFGGIKTFASGLTVNGTMVLQETTAPSGTTGYGKLYVSSSDNKLHFVNASGVDIALGGASGAKTIKLVPEFAGVVFTADGSNNTGFMQTEHVAGLSSGQGYKHNYYSWTTDQGTAQDYNITAIQQLPSDFSSFTASSFKIWTYVTTTTSTNIEITIRDATDQVCYASTGWVSGKPSANATWEQITFTNPGNGCSFAANDLMTITIRPTAISPTTTEVRVGEIEFGYTP